MFYFNKQTIERFWAKVDKNHPDAKVWNGTKCWIWIGCRHPHDYGVYEIRITTNVRENWRVHRFVWAMLHGRIPAGKEICHGCDNTLCVNPAHLFAGTHLDNMRDMVAKNRQRCLHGEQHRMAKLTAEEAKAIYVRNKYDGFSTVKLARIYGVSQGAVWFICARWHWREATRGL